MENIDRDFLYATSAEALISVARGAAERDLVPLESPGELGGEKVAVVVGLVTREPGKKGRFLLEMDQGLAEDLPEGMNGGPLDDATELYLFSGELLNMVGGKALTVINNRYRGLEYRLTPPAIFAGKGLEILTPLVRSQVTWYRGARGVARFDVGFEGV